MASYATVEELTDRWESRASPTSAQIGVMVDILEAISRKIDRFTGRPDNAYKVPDAASYKYYSGTGGDYQVINECVEISQVAVKTSYDETTYDAWTSPTSNMSGDGDWIPASGDSRSPKWNTTPFTLLIIDPNGDYSYFTRGMGYPTVRVSARWGYSETVPSYVREACLAQALILIKRFQGAMSSAIANYDLGVISSKIRQAALTKDVQDLLVNSNLVLPLYARQV